SPLRRADGSLLVGDASVYELVPVHVEANTNGGSRTSPDRIPPDDWLEQFIRKAPFDVAEVLVEAERTQLAAGSTHALLVDVSVSPGAEAGVYGAELRLKAGDAATEVPFSLRVHQTVVPADAALHSTYWFFPQPGNLTSGEAPEWWSQRHWELIENSGRQLRAFGQDSILTPLIDLPEPLIQTIRNEDESYSFDYARFDRWAELFLGLGFRYLHGHHISMLPETWIYEGVFVTDRETGEREPLVIRGGANEDWLAFVPVFYRSLH
ncbi:unnamed protein product, partial [marine sediment metagenome]